MSEKNVMEVLTKRFPIREIKTREGGRGRTLYYISQDSAVDRLNEAFGAEWSVKYDLLGYQDFNTRTREGNTSHRYVAVSATITYVINGNSFSKTGYGADDVDKQMGDLDMAIKSAGSSALKKAASYLGVGLYLAVEEERQAIQTQMNIQKDYPLSATSSDNILRLKKLCGVSGDNPIPETVKNKIVSPLVEEWSKGGLVHWSDLNAKNVEEFLTWAEQLKK